MALTLVSVGASPDLSVAAAAASKKETTRKGTESLESVQAKLDVVGKKLVSDAARTVTPTAKAKAVAPADKGFAATYVEVDQSSLTTEVRPASGPGGQYVGVIKYLENHYECRGATKAEALSAPCAKVKTRRMNELIRYDNGKWSF